MLLLTHTPPVSHSPSPKPHTLTLAPATLVPYGGRGVGPRALRLRRARRVGGGLRQACQLNSLSKRKRTRRLPYFVFLFCGPREGATSSLVVFCFFGNYVVQLPPYGRYEFYLQDPHIIVQKCRCCTAPRARRASPPRTTATSQASAW